MGRRAVAAVGRDGGDEGGGDGGGNGGDGGGNGGGDSSGRGDGLRKQTMRVVVSICTIGARRVSVEHVWEGECAPDSTTRACS